MLKDCERCGDEYRPPTQNTRYCPVCRIARDLSTMKEGFSKECENCNKEFFPIRRSYALCPDCTVIRHNGEAECALCHQKNRLAPGLQQTCIFCVSASAVNRSSYRKTLVRLISEKIKEKSKQRK